MGTMPLSALDSTAAARRHPVSRLCGSKSSVVLWRVGKATALSRRVNDGSEQLLLGRQNFCGCTVADRLRRSLREQIAGKQGSHLIDTSSPETVEVYSIDTFTQRACNA